LPQEIKKDKTAQQQRLTNIESSISALNERLEKVEEAVGHYPEYRKQSIDIQGQLKQADCEILDVCKIIKEDVVANREMLDTRLKSLERREKNALRAKILDEYRLYTDEHKNPMLA
jgi:hypothetical protein